MLTAILAVLEDVQRNHPGTDAAAQAASCGAALRDASTPASIRSVLDALAYFISDSWPFTYPEGPRLLGLIQGYRAS